MEGDLEQTVEVRRRSPLLYMPAPKLQKTMTRKRCLAGLTLDPHLLLVLHVILAIFLLIYLTHEAFYFLQIRSYPAQLH